MLSLSVAFMERSTSRSQSSTFPVGLTGSDSFTSSPSPEYIDLGHMGDFLHVVLESELQAVR
ncbi:hypothetical protein EYF80_048925 [Liparis tanakae]|uniref:Uncharacterized protein n=1 Tax=Liparis tanakae TaxID=230148 RepID=A0A4Z2FI68_9TELE|nr:hypothetical protein EYF80_048925 [Liparis tanakae]